MAPTPKEQGDVGLLVAMMGESISAEAALKVLRKYNGDLDKAASALLEGDAASGSATIDPMDVTMTGAPPPTPRKEKVNPVIDLTADDEDKELSRALQASLEDQAPTFGPSNRAPDPNWAVVPSHVQVGAALSQDDQSLSRAIEESLAYGQNDDVFMDLALEDRVRKDGRPVALRPTHTSLSYAGLLLHSLFYVPQVRHAVARWQPPPKAMEDDYEIGPSTLTGPTLVMFSLLELFVNMDLAQMSELSVDAAIGAFDAEHWSNPVERPGDISFQFYSRLAMTVETAVREDLDNPSDPSAPRLFHFRYGNCQADLSQAPFGRPVDLAVVKVDLTGVEGGNDLISCLSADLGLTGESTDPAKQQVIFEASEVVAFQLARDHPGTSYGSTSSGSTERKTFVYPKLVYLDQFLRDNFEFSSAKRRRQRELYEEIDRLMKKKESLTKFNDRDTLSALRSSVHYYENVAEDDGDAQRKSTIQSMAIKLRKTLTRIDNELQTIDATVTKLKTEASNIFDCPELCKHGYDLRAVLVHDGIYGRSHVYSYVKDKDNWWKTLDYSVTQVSEDAVLNDPTGLHFGAGPYFLLYSRTLSKEEEDMRAPWPEGIKNSVKHNNRVFFSQLAPEVAAQIDDPNSPPTSPNHSATPSEYTISSGTVEPPLSRGDPMDTTD